MNFSKSRSKPKYNKIQLCLYNLQSGIRKHLALGKELMELLAMLEAILHKSYHKFPCLVRNQYLIASVNPKIKLYFKEIYLMNEIPQKLQFQIKKTLNLEINCQKLKIRRKSQRKMNLKVSLPLHQGESQKILILKHITFNSNKQFSL